MVLDTAEVKALEVVVVVDMVEVMALEVDMVQVKALEVDKEIVVEID